MHGKFKFVLDRNNNLYIGSSSSYHREICKDLHYKSVVAAGYLQYHNDKWYPNGRSIGYDISFNESQAEAIEKFLSTYSETDIMKTMFESGEWIACLKIAD
jgi:hypothetical protein